MKKKKKKVHGPQSKYWKKKADEQWSLAIRLRDMKCLICGKEGLYQKKEKKYINGLQAHHLIGRNNLQFRYELQNGITLCNYCHIYDPKWSPHYSTDSTSFFLEWLEQTDHWYFFEDNRHNRMSVKMNYEEEYLRLKEVNSSFTESENKK